MQCPKCLGTLRPVTFHGTEIDRCDKCEGMWFDFGEQQDLKRVEGSEAIDTGATHDPARDAKQRVMCPRDKVQMVRMVDPAKPQVWFESCPLCYGVFLDATEFRELKQDTSFWDRLVRKRRPRPLK
jgi:Zn-finger nucleic acid-binding protein